MLVDTINRFARSVDYPSIGGAGNLSLASDVAAPGTAWQNASYGMQGLGQTLRQRAGLGDFTVLGDYFTSTNYYLGFVALAGLAYMVVGGLGNSKAAKRRTVRRAGLKGQIAREQELLKSA